MKQKIALVIGATGQDGSYMSKLLIDRNYIVFGTTRDTLSANLSNLKLLKIDKEVKLLKTSTSDFRSLVFTLQQVNPDEIYHLGGQNGVGLSFQFPFESVESLYFSTLSLLEAVRFFNKEIKVFIPSSTDCFGTTTIENPANEYSQHKPMSPYAVAKSSSYWISKTYRESYGMFVCVGFLSNHISPLSGKQIVTSKLFSSIKQILNNEITHIYFGDLSIIRDWGWAPSYVEAIHKMLQFVKPDDYIIASGNSYRLYDLVKKAFEIAGLGNCEDFIKSRNSEIRPNEIKTSYLDPTKAKNVLNWKNQYNIDEIISNLLKNNLF